MNSQEIYNTLKSLEKNVDFHDIPEIRNAIIKCEDAIICIINTPEKLNPSLAYDLQLIVSSLIDVLKDKKKNLRKSQIVSLVSIMNHIILGGTKGLIKLPTGAGKTRLFSEIVTGLNLPTVILVPKINLRGQTSEYFEGENVFNIGENGTVINNTRSILKTIKQRKIYNPIIIATYQSFVRLKSDKLLFKEFSKLIKVVIRDEAHRSLGDKTEEALDEMHSYNDVDGTVLQEQDKDLLETDISDSNEKLELLFTATPKLLDKSVRDTYDEIFGLRLQDLVEEGVLHMPKFIQVSEASIYIGDSNVGEKVLNQFATKFVNENGEYTYSEITDTYIELKKQNNGYLPAVGFCRDIQHAEFIKNHLEEKGIRAIRVTSENSEFDKGISEDEAKKMIEANEVDVVVTVTKVSEGWDVPTLRCALNFAPILSEAKYIQGTGRVLRTFDFEEKEEENKQNGVLPKNFAFVIEPKFWTISSGTGNTGEGEIKTGGNKGNKTGENDKKMKIKISGITHLIDSGEFDINYLSDLYGDLDEYSELITQEKVLEYFKTSKSFEEWMNVNQKQIREIEYKGKKIMSLSTLTGWNNYNNVDLSILSGFREFIAWIFGKEVENMTSEELLEYFRTTKTYEEWMDLNYEHIREIEYKGKKITSLAFLIGWNNPNNLNLYALGGFREFIAGIFGKEVKTVTSGEVLKYFRTVNTYEEWGNLGQKQISEIEYKGKKIKGLVLLSGWNNYNNVDVFKLSGFREFISWVFGKEVENITSEDILGYFRNEEIYDNWIKLPQKHILEIEYKGKKITSLAFLTGWNNPNNVNLKTVSGFREFISWVFGKKSQNKIDEDVLEYFRTTKTYEEWGTLNKKQISEIEYKGKKIKGLVSLSGWNNPNIDNIHSFSGFREFISWIFGKEVENITSEELLKYFRTTKTYEEWIKLPQKHILEIEYKGKKITSLASLTGWNNSNNINVITPSGFREFISWIFGKEVMSITSEEVLKYFRTVNTYEEWGNLGQKQISEIEYKGKKIKGLVSLSGWNNPNNVDVLKVLGFNEFKVWVFKKN